MSKGLPGSRLYKFGLPRYLPRVFNYYGDKEGLAYHEFDTGEIFNVSSVFSNLPHDINTSSIMINFWTEFAKNGTRMTQWPVASVSDDFARVEGHWYFDATSKFVDRPFDTWDVCSIIEELNFS